jgi:hypothetical protein
VRDEEYTLYCQLDNELGALAREGDAWKEQGHLHNVVVMLGNESILRRNAAATGAHSGRIAVPDFAAVKRPNGLELVVLSVLQCIHADGINKRGPRDGATRLIESRIVLELQSARGIRSAYGSIGT